MGVELLINASKSGEENLKDSKTSKTHVFDRSTALLKQFFGKEKTSRGERGVQKLILVD